MPTLAERIRDLEQGSNEEKAQALRLKAGMSQYGSPGESAGGASQQAPSGAPERPMTTSLLNDSGLLKSQYQLMARPDVAFNPTAINTQAIEELRKRGLATGPTQQAQYLQQQQQLDEQNQLGNAARQQAGASSYAFGQAASHGGLSSGSRERLAQQAVLGLSGARQDVARQGMGQRLGILSNDEAQKLGILQNLPGQELGLSGFNAAQEAQKANLGLANREYGTRVEERNLTGAMNEVGRMDNAELQKYKEKMASYAAEKTAQAQASAGKK